MYIMFAFQTASFVSPKEEVRAHIASLSFMRTTNTMAQAGYFLLPKRQCTGYVDMLNSIASHKCSYTSRC